MNLESHKYEAGVLTTRLQRAVIDLKNYFLENYCNTDKVRREAIKSFRTKK
jgi:hypothetical protein